MGKFKRVLLALTAVATLSGVGVIVTAVADDSPPVAEAATYMGTFYENQWGVTAKAYCTVGYSVNASGSKFCDDGYTLQPYPGTSSYCYKRWWWGYDYDSDPSNNFGIILWSSGGYSMRNGGSLTYVC